MKKKGKIKSGGFVLSLLNPGPRKVKFVKSFWGKNPFHFKNLMQQTIAKNYFNFTKIIFRRNKAERKNQKWGYLNSVFNPGPRKVESPSDFFYRLWGLFGVII